MNEQLGRRALLKLGALGAAAGVMAPGLLAGCSSGATRGGAAASSKVKLPTYVPFDGPRPDLPGNADGLEPGFTSFPKELVASVEGKPGDGSKVQGLTEIWVAPPPPMARNQFWQTLNDELGVTLSLILGTDPGYPEKFAALVASDDLPDLMWFPPNQGITHVAELLQAKFTDLTPLLSGDAVKEYPNLAALQPTGWRTSVVNGKIWGPPIPQGVFGQIFVGNNKVWDAVGGFQCENLDEFVGKCKEVTRPRENRWALDSWYVNAVHMFSQWTGAPNQWRKNDDGSLTHTFETEEYAEAVSIAAKLRKAGYFYPEADISDNRTPFLQGRIGAIVRSGPDALDSRSTDRLQDPEMEEQLLVPFGQDGGKGVHNLGYGTIGFTAVKKAKADRVEMLLRVLDYLAAPFGSREWLFLRYGTEGTHHTKDGKGAPKQNEAWKREVEGLQSGLGTMSGPSRTLYDATYPDNIEYVHGVQEKLLDIAQPNPTIGYYSDAYTKDGAKITTDFYDFVNDAVSDRKKVTEIKEAVSRWRKEGGDTMRDEYEKAIAKDG